MFRAVSARIRRRLAGEDTTKGMTLIEMLVSLAIFSILIIITMAAVVTIARSTVNAQGRAESSSGILIGFQTLDRQVRYADSINYPGTTTSGRYSYVEFRTSAAASVNGYTTCTQWRYDSTNGVIQMRQWKDASGATLGSWQTKVLNVTGTASKTYPFILKPATGGGTTMQQLTLNIVAGAVSTAGQTEIVTNYVARNSSIASPGNTDGNGDLVSDTPVCLTTGNRP